MKNFKDYLAESERTYSYRIKVVGDTAPDFIKMLEYKIIPMYYNKNKTSWVEEMKLSIGNSGSYFNTHRMAKEYVSKAYRLK